MTPATDFLVRLLFSTGRKRIFKEEGNTGWDGTLHAENYVRLSAPSREPLDETVNKDSSQLATRKSSERAGKPAEEDARCCHRRHLNTWNVYSKFWGNTKVNLKIDEEMRHTNGRDDMPSPRHHPLSGARASKKDPKKSSLPSPSQQIHTHLLSFFPPCSLLSLHQISHARCHMAGTSPAEEKKFSHRPSKQETRASPSISLHPSHLPEVNSKVLKLDLELHPANNPLSAPLNSGTVRDKASW